MCSRGDEGRYIFFKSPVAWKSIWCYLPNHKIACPNIVIVVVIVVVLEVAVILFHHHCHCHYRNCHCCHCCCCCCCCCCCHCCRRFHSGSHRVESCILQVLCVYSRKPEHFKYVFLLTWFKLSLVLLLVFSSASSNGGGTRETIQVCFLLFFPLSIHLRHYLIWVI